MKNNSGTALIITLLLLTILTGITVEFAYSVYINTSALANWIDAQKASLLNKSAQEFVLSHLNEIMKTPIALNRDTTLPLGLYTMGNENITIRVEDENAKLNINSIIYPNGRTNEAALYSFKRLLKYLEIDPVVADIIADWIDPDAEPRVAGAETGAKNTYLWSIDELRLIEGVDEETFKTIKPFITIYGNGMININTADLPVIMSLHDGMTKALAEKVLYYRENTPFSNKADITKIAGLEGIGIDIQNRITVESSCHTIITRTTINDITRVTESVIDKSRTVLYWRET